MARALEMRQGASNIKIDPNGRCLRIYPVEDNAIAGDWIGPCGHRFPLLCGTVPQNPGHRAAPPTPGG